jgi:preprotein translocase subunit SecD
VLIIVMVLAIVGQDAFSPGNWRHHFKVQLGIDLAGGTSDTLHAQSLSGKPVTESYMNEARAIMIARVNGAGFSGAQVQQQGSTDMVITVPGASTQKVVRLVGTTAQLSFRQLLLEGAPTATTTSASPGASHTPGEAATPRATSTPSTSPSVTPTSTPPAASQVSGDTSKVDPAVLKLFNKLDCNHARTWKKQIGYTTAIYDNPNVQTVSCSSAGAAQGLRTLKYVLAPAKVLGSEVTSAQAGAANQQQSLSNQWQVNLSLNGKGTAAFGTLTEQMNSQYGNGGHPTSPLDQLAVVLDGQVVSAPDIDQGAIPGGNAQITYFPRSEAQNLAQELNYGALPVTLSQLNVESTSPSLGSDQLEVGLIAAAIGLGLVVIYSFFYYRGLGLVSVSSLIVAGVLAFLSVVLLSKYASSGFSLSLAGIAGLIVAIGITADSFVVYFERLRDEVREGKSLRPAVESGWKRARRTILVSDQVLRRRAPAVRARPGPARRPHALAIGRAETRVAAHQEGT